MGSATLTPTIVVGLGNAGSKMAAAVNERAAKENVAEYVEILGIDTRPEDVTNALPSDASSLVLETDEGSFAGAQDLAPYLEEIHELPPTGGTARQRPVGRHFLDNPNELGHTYHFLETHVEEFVTELNESISDTPVEELNVWVVNSLAGGTGSGIFPLVAGLLAEVLAELESERRIETTLRGVGSLNSLDRLDEQVVKPANPPSSYLNAYTALSELQTVLNEESASISLHPDASLFVKDELDVGGVFDQYLLVGLREQKQDYLNSVNEIVADAIYYFGAVTALYDGKFNFPKHPEYRGPASLFSLDAGKLTFPVETADEYVALGEEIVSTRKERDRLEYEREERADDLHYLDALLSLDRGSMPSSESPIPRTLVRRCEEEAVLISREASPDELDTHINDVSLEDLFEIAEDRDFDSSTVVRHLLLSQLIPIVEQKRTRTREELSDLVTNLMHRYQNSLQEYVDEDDMSTFESNPSKAAEEIADFLEIKLNVLVEEREESLPIFGDPFRDLEARIEEVKQSLDKLTTRRSAYERYEALSENVHRAFDESRDTLSILRKEIEQTRYELDDKIDEHTHKVEEMQMRRERLTTELSEHTQSHHHTSIGVEQPESLTPEILERAREEGFTVLVEADLIEREAIEEALDHVCLNRQEPIQDIPASQPPFSVVAPILAEENTKEWLDDIESAAMEAGFDMIESQVDTTDTLSIGLLGLYVDINLEATSEFGTLDEYLNDPDRELRELFGSEVDHIPNPFAYPELH